MWQAIAAIAVPVITLLASFFNRTGSGLSKRIKHHADLAKQLDSLPAAHAVMTDLLVAEVSVLAARETARASRKLNYSNLILSVVLAGITAATIYWAISLWRDAPDGFWSFTLAGVISLTALFFVLLSFAGFGTLYNPPKTQAEKDQDTASKLARREAKDK
jgi:hypothetical protein